MGAAENRELIQYYKDRRVWLVQPDKNPAQVALYSIDPTAGSALAVSQSPISRLKEQAIVR
jgi:hypothetical protein